uniref:Uncharacterized protein n=1 Tax=Megaviridae environmental sample TaxID=1737588 RepID=A0A5J6VIN5_9VIRU|nr:MAG: hypothetical protein [Megaviridae environmental sample]
MDEKRQQIRNINNMNITIEEKNRLIFNLMQPNIETRNTDFDLKKPRKVCSHYNKWLSPVDPDTSTVAGCRICKPHDRFKVKMMQCDDCMCIQKKASVCGNPICYSFNKPHKYYCRICSLWQNAPGDIYHCDKCGMCRIGRQEDYEHCDKCGLCVKDIQNHACISSAIDAKCSVCLDGLHDSRLPSTFMQCNHIIHALCFQKLLLGGEYRCPICKKSAIDMKEQWKIYDQITLHSPPEYNWMQAYTCNDCGKKSKKRFNLENLYRCECNSYNTQSTHREHLD